MGDTLQSLHRLQTVERQIAAIRRNRDTKSKRVESLQRQVRQIDERIRQFQLQAREQQVKIDAVSLDVSSREESVAKHREGLNKAKTNKEYSAILAAMNTEKADNTKLEATIMQHSEELGKIQAEMAKVNEEKAKLQTSLSGAQKALDDYDQSVKTEREKLLASREDFAKVVNPVTLQTFIRVAEHHDGEAMAVISKIHPKREEYMCGGCNIGVTLDMVNALKTRDEILLCRSCGRILYAEPATAAR